MSRVIIFCGQSGSGKTTLAKDVSKRLNMVCLHKDSIKEKLYELEGGKTLEDSQRIGKVAIFLQLDLAEELIGDGIDVMIEAPFNHPDNTKRFEQWVSQYAIDLRVVVCEVDEKEREKRYRERPRHRSHHDQARLTQGLFPKEVFDYAVFPGKKLFIDTARPVEDCVKEILAFLA